MSTTVAHNILTCCGFKHCEWRRLWWCWWWGRTRKTERKTELDVEVAFCVFVFLVFFTLFLFRKPPGCWFSFFVVVFAYLLLVFHTFLFNTTTATQHTLQRLLCALLGMYSVCSTQLIWQLNCVEFRWNAPVRIEMNLPQRWWSVNWWKKENIIFLLLLAEKNWIFKRAFSMDLKLKRLRSLW